MRRQPFAVCRRDKQPIVDEHDEIDRWCAARLTAEDLEFVASFQSVAEYDVGETSCCFYHGSPRSNLDEILLATPDAGLDDWYQGRRATVFGGGHTHVRMARRHRDSFAINPGSVGLPFTTLRNVREVDPLWAEYGVISEDGSRVVIELLRTPVDKATLYAAAAGSGMPCLAWWSRDWE